MLQIGTTSDQFGYSHVSNVRAAVKLDVRELGAPSGQGRQALIGYLRTVAEEQPLNLGTRARSGATTQPAQHAPDRLIATRVLAAQRDRLPQNGLPREILPSMAHGRARTKVRAVEIREYLEHQFISEPIETRTYNRPGLRPPVLSGRRVQWQIDAATAAAAGH